MVDTMCNNNKDLLVAFPARGSFCQYFFVKIFNYKGLMGIGHLSVEDIIGYGNCSIIAGDFPKRDQESPHFKREECGLNLL